MPMKFTKLVKGNLNETLVKILLEDVGYQAVPLGIEQVVGEVKALTREEYKSLGLRPQLRTLPDFLVIDRGKNRHRFLEGCAFSPLRRFCQAEIVVGSM